MSQCTTRQRSPTVNILFILALNILQPLMYPSYYPDIMSMSMVKMRKMMMTCVCVFVCVCGYVCF